MVMIIVEYSFYKKTQATNFKELLYVYYYMDNELHRHLIVNAGNYFLDSRPFLEPTTSTAIYKSLYTFLYQVKKSLDKDISAMNHFELLNDGERLVSFLNVSLLVFENSKIYKLYVRFLIKNINVIYSRLLTIGFKMIDNNYIPISPKGFEFGFNPVPLRLVSSITEIEPRQNNIRVLTLIYNIFNQILFPQYKTHFFRFLQDNELHGHITHIYLYLADQIDIFRFENNPHQL